MSNVVKRRVLISIERPMSKKTKKSDKGRIEVVKENLRWRRNIYNAGTNILDERM